MKDLKEFFHVYPGCRLPDELNDLTRQIYTDLESLGRELLGWIENRAPTSVSGKLSMPLGEMMEGSDQSLLRILHYPPVEDAEPGAIRAAAHEDINLITLLLSGSKPGLQAQDADVFVHEVAAASAATLANFPAVKVAIDHHATPAEVGRVFAQTRPKLAMLTHLVLLPPDPVPINDVMTELAREYDGTVVVAEDLMTIQIGRNISVIPYRHGGKPGGMV